MAVYTGAKWGSGVFGTAGGTVTYSFASLTTTGTSYSYTGQLDASYQQVIHDCFEQWSYYADIDFVFTYDTANADIVIGWDTIDGVDGTLGECSYSYYTDGSMASAEIRFDTAEDWSLSGGTASWTDISFEAVALHEIGHAIGLSHTATSDSIMYSYYGGSLDLTAGDISGIQALYGAAAAQSDSIYYFMALNSSGDYYYGYAYADTGSYYEGQYVYPYYATDEDGGYWYYYVYDSYDYGYDTAYEGQSYGYAYYDSQYGSAYSSYASGSSGIGSEFGYAYYDSSYAVYDGFGSYGYYEADYYDVAPTGDSIYYFLALNSSGDYYYGYSYADAGSYYEGQYVYPYYATDEDGGYWYYYVYDSYDYGYDTAYEGQSYGYAYYDSQYGSAYSSYASGSSGIGSEFGYAYYDSSYAVYDGFGYYGYYEADYYDVAPTGDSIYYFLALNSSGDYYYGYAYADTGSYYEGQYVYPYYATDEDGGYWYYYVYDSYDYGYDTTYEGQSYGYAYYDSQYGSVYSSYASGANGIGSEFGYAYYDSSYTVYDGFGYYGYYEADYYDAV